MNAYSTAQRAYASSEAPTRTDRSTEYDAFARITGALKAAIAASAKDYRALATALHENRRLWMLMGTSVVDDANALSKQLRAQILYLADFTLQHTTKVLNGSAQADILVEINTSVMKGLRAQGQPA